MITPSYKKMQGGLHFFTPFLNLLPRAVEGAPFDEGNSNSMLIYITIIIQLQ
jgi:hypothetical protein